MGNFQGRPTARAAILVVVWTLSASHCIAAGQKSPSSALRLPADSVLLPLIFPDIDADGKAHKSVKIRSLHRDYEPSEMYGTISVQTREKMLLRNGSRRDVLLVCEVSHDGDGGSPWGGETLLAMFRLRPKAQLLDVVDVRADRESGLWDKPALLRAGQYDCPVIYASHLNAGEDYLTLEIVEIVGDRFAVSKAILPNIFSARTGTGDIRPTPSLQLLPNSVPPTAVFRLRVIGELRDQDSQKVKRTETRTFKAKLFASRGRWQCPSCAHVGKAAAAMEKRYGFSDD